MYIPSYPNNIPIGANYNSMCPSGPNSKSDLSGKFELSEGVRERAQIVFWCAGRLLHSSVNKPCL